MSDREAADARSGQKAYASSAVAAILRKPVARRGRSSGGEGGGMSWSPSMVCTSRVVDV